MDGIVGMIKMVLSLNATAEWLPCDGRLLQAADYPALFAMIGNRFGGDGRVDFALPIVPQQEAAHFMVKVAPTAQDDSFQGLVAQMVLWVGAELPAHWLPCDGRLVQGSDYPLLQKVAAQGANGVPMTAFHLPLIPAGAGLQYMICVDGLDPTAGAGGGPQVMSDDDY